jgi:glycosyltransferase involved in cell wall biosynthesis
MSKKITLLNQVTGPLFIDIANKYAEIYDEVILVTGVIEPTYATLDDKVKIVYKTTYKRNKSYLRILTWLFFFIQTYFYFLFKKQENGEEVLIVSNPPILPFLGSVLFFKRKIKFKVLIYDVYPDALLNFGYLKKTSYIYKFWDKMNKKAYMYADEIITISSVMKKVITRNVESSKIKIIYPWVDTSLIKPIKNDDNWFIEENNISEKKIILYSGNMGLTHDLMTPLKVAKELSETHPDFHFLFIGDGAQKKKLMTYVEKNMLNNVTFLNYQQSNVLPYSFASADFAIVSLSSGAEGLSVPSKTFYSLAAGSAIIAISEKGSEIEQLISKNDCGISIQPNEVSIMRDFLTNTSDLDLEQKKKNSRILSNQFTVANVKYFLK